MVRDGVGSLGWLRKRIEDADTDLLREMVKAVAEMFMWVSAQHSPFHSDRGVARRRPGEASRLPR